MGKINSRQKGSKNERDICKWWKAWTGYDFSRVPSSGGLRWSRTTDTTGDIICSDKKHYLRFPFSIECKNYKDINFEHILLGNKNAKVIQFWNQALEDSQRGGKLPILMMRYNGMKKGEYFFVVQPAIGKLIFDSMDVFSRVDINYMRIKYNSENLSIYMATDILKLSSYESVYRESRKQLKATKK